MKILKDLFENDNISNAFDLKLKKFLDQINPEDVPSNLSSFYNRNKKNNEIIEKKIKFNNKILHQSKLIRYFNGEYSKVKWEDDLNKFLKKIKKDKKYFISKKDIIFLEALKSDGIKISKKYSDLYKVNKSEMPLDIQRMIDNKEIGAALLRVIEVIGPDKIEDIDEDTFYFIVNTLNQLDADLIRNKQIWSNVTLKFFFDDVELFLSLHKEEIDMLKLLDLLKPVKIIKNKEIFNDEDLKDIKTLEVFLLKNNNFKKINDQSIIKRKNNSKENIDIARSNLNNLLEFTYSYLVNNALEEGISGLTRVYNEYKDTSKLKHYNEINKIISLIKNELNILGVNYK